MAKYNPKKLFLFIEILLLKMSFVVVCIGILLSFLSLFVQIIQFNDDVDVGDNVAVAVAATTNDDDH